MSMVLVHFMWRNIIIFLSFFLNSASSYERQTNYLQVYNFTSCTISLDHRPLIRSFPIFCDFSLLSKFLFPYNSVFNCLVNCYSAY